jgi:hypothetical protein
MTWLQYPFSFFSLLGAMLICSRLAKRRCYGFGCFIISNCCMITYSIFEHMKEDATGLIITYFAFLILSIVGLYNNCFDSSRDKKILEQ